LEEAGRSAKRIKYAVKEIVPFANQGSHYGLKTADFQFIKSSMNIHEFYDWQDECLRLPAIHQRKNLVYLLPTGGGKTVVGVMLIIREIVLRNKDVMLVLPYVSIVQEKILELQLLSNKFGFTVEDYSAGKGSLPPIKRPANSRVVRVCTIEKAQMLFDSLKENYRIQQLGLIVVDELHMLGDMPRGANLEMLLTKANFHNETATSTKIQIVGMSATIENKHEISQFLDADLYVRNFRPVELTEYIKFGKELYRVIGKPDEPKRIELVRDDYGKDYSQKEQMLDPDHLSQVICKVMPQKQVLVFCATKKKCEDVAWHISKMTHTKVTEYKADLKASLISRMEADCEGKVNPLLLKLIPYGIAFHNSDLLSDERRHVEEAYRCGIITVICCTTTLAAGVNLPAGRVVIRDPYIAGQFLSLSRYKQMVGRAGRAGKTEKGDSIIICKDKDRQALEQMLGSKMDLTVSAFLQNELTEKESDKLEIFKTAVMNCIGNGLASSVNQLVAIFRLSLLNIQIQKHGNTVRQMINVCVTRLIKEEALYLTAADYKNQKYAAIELESMTFYPYDTLSVSTLGKAAVAGNMSVTDAKKLQEDLKIASQGLNVEMNLHLLYLVMSKEVMQSIYLRPDAFYDIYISRTAAQRAILARFGITEEVVERLKYKYMTASDRDSVRCTEQMVRFAVALLLEALWNQEDIIKISELFKISRAVAYRAMQSSAMQAYCVYRFCDAHSAFWALRDVLAPFSKRLGYCCSAHLVPLMELPTVKIGRAKLLYENGFDSVEKLAAMKPQQLCDKLKMKLSLKHAKQIVDAARVS